MIVEADYSRRVITKRRRRSQAVHRYKAATSGANDRDAYRSFAFDRIGVGPAGSAGREAAVMWPARGVPVQPPRDRSTAASRDDDHNQQLQRLE